MNDLISRKALCDYALNQKDKSVTPNDIMRFPSAQSEPIKINIDDFNKEDLERFKKELGNTPITVLPAQPEQRWIPFKTRPLTKEEKEEHPEWDSILDFKLPDDGQRILVSVSVRGHESVQYDEFYTDDGSYLDSGYEIGTEAVAWMPLPEPYREERTEE